MRANKVGRPPEEMVGKKFYKWEILEESPERSSSGVIKYVCRCDCGKISSVSGVHIRMGLTRGCAKCGDNPKRFTKGEAPHNIMPEGESQCNVLFGRYKKRATKMGLKWELSVSEFKSITSSNCYYCGKEPKQIVSMTLITNGRYTYNGIDRVDNNIGYVEGNCVACCKFCNRAKDVMSKDEFIDSVSAIYRMHGWKHGVEYTHYTEAGR